MERTIKKALRAICGHSSVGSLRRALDCLAVPLLFGAICLVFVIILFWCPSKLLVVVLFVLFLVLIGLL